ncbi:[protein release factor]-glutamine N5-methyltransferase [Nitrosospira sp. Nl5]|uniref:peptide chain release factor N(5)-glutamine methyltransferase n=1 Tax=Nitrosospira sp. Nl5 TaxID=200120 RepID=UPI00088A5BB4|nr:peptide chain release factor N(5)-glutamine methyltransferase [Nitrosospira sp. Nl5]SCY52705.1 [protein release factor]-glutamine N5-methyltransferase [Nitrosospira sp. Nl5]
MQQITILQALSQARGDIGDTDARLLLQTVLNVNHAHLIAHSDQELVPAEAQYLHQLIARRAQGEPVAYLMGKREFYGLSFKVTPAVLIPRPETELLVDLALERMPLDHSSKILDLGTGSGAIAISIANHRPLANITAVDASADAVAVAKINARQLNVNNIRIIEGDWFGGLAGKRFDLIVSNPPYIAGSDPHLAQGDLRFEPQTALTTGGDSLDCIRCIIASAAAHLVAGGTLLLEHGYDQAEACRQLLDKAGFCEVFSRPDLAGIMRASGGVWEFPRETARI